MPGKSNMEVGGGDYPVVSRKVKLGDWKFVLGFWILIMKRKNKRF